MGESLLQIWFCIYLLYWNLLWNTGGSYLSNCNLFRWLITKQIKNNRFIFNTVRIIWNTVFQHLVFDHPKHVLQTNSFPRNISFELFCILYIVFKILLSDMYFLCIRICPINIATVMAGNSKSLLQNQISRVIVLVQKVKFDRF